MSQAQGQFTIIDYNDAITLAGFVGTNLAKTQMYNPDNGSYTPNWESTNMVLTPSLFVAGSSSDVITSSAVQSVSWYDGSSGTAITAGTNYALSGTKNHVLTIKKNVLAGLPGKDYRCVVVYRDATTNLDLTYTMSITLSRVVNGGGIVDLLVTTPDGNVFKNGSASTLTAKAELWRGSSVDTTNVTYKWAEMDPSVTSSSSTGYDADFGVGWRKLSNSTGHFSGATTATLTIYDVEVDSVSTFMCIATDTDSASPTYNGKFKDTCTLTDMSDPYYVEISSTGGDVFKNGLGSTTLTAQLYRAGSAVNPNGATYTWSRYDKDGVQDTSWGTNGNKTGKTLSVGDGDVDVKATFMVVVTGI